MRVTSPIYLNINKTNHLKVRELKDGPSRKSVSPTVKVNKGCMFCIH